MNFSLGDFYRRYHRPTLKPRSAADYDIQLRHVSRWWANQETSQRQVGGSGDQPTATEPTAATPETAAGTATPETAAQDPRLSDLSVSFIVGAMNHQLAAGVSRSTADKVRRFLSAVWHLAYSMTELRQFVAPPEKVTKLRSPSHAPTAWTVEDFERILLGAERLVGRVGPFLLSKWFAVLLRLEYNSGLRIDTAMQLRWEWVDLDEATLVIPPEAQKDDEGQIIQLLPHTVEALRSLRPTAGASCDSASVAETTNATRRAPAEVFGDWQYDRNVTQWPALTLRLRKCIVAAGLRDEESRVTKRDLWHKIRRTFATAMYAKSGDIELVRDMLGHCSIDVTYRYIDKSKLGRKLQADYLSDPDPYRLRIAETG